MKKYFWIFFILIISSQVTKSQTYFSLTADSSNLTYTGIETDLTFHIKLHNSTGSLQNYKWIRSNPCLMPNGLHLYAIVQLDITPQHLQQVVLSSTPV